ncbi:MAG TPA: hypothetical protein VGI75_05310, partial [Pirellulales bacterium]
MADKLQSDWHNEMGGSVDDLCCHFRQVSDQAYSSGDTKLARLRDADLLTWGRTFLPDHFRLPPSRMHRWLAEQLDGAAANRGLKLNVVGPRGSAKSTVATLAFVLR